MPKNVANISDRLKGILSDLSSFVGKDSSSTALPACESHDRDLFINRVHSFKSSSWFAKPCWLSPTMCARYGWINIDIDLLQCVGCQSVLVVRTPSSFDPAIYDACQKRLEDQLKRNAHHPCCTWPSCPTPEVIILAHSCSSSQASVIEDFINKAVLLYSIGKDLPAVEYASFNVSESAFTDLCNLVTKSPKFPRDAEIPGALHSAVLLALTGWDLSTSRKAFTGCTSLQCSLCMRQPGLWNYISITDGTDREASVETCSHSESLSDHEINAENEPVGSQTAANHSSCSMIDSQLSPCEIVDFRTETDGTSFPVVVEGSLPLMTTGNFMDLQESLMSSQEVEAIDESQNRLPNAGCKDDELCSLAVSSDRDDDTEVVTSDVIGAADADEHGGHSGGATANALESLSGFLPSENKNSASSAVDEQEHCAELTENIEGNEKMAYYDELQMTDGHLACNTEQQESDTLDIDVTEESRIESSKHDSDTLDVCPEFDNTSNREDATLDAAGAEEIIDDSADILTARDEYTGTHKAIDECSHDEFISSDNVEEVVDSGDSEEDVSVEPHGNAVDGSVTAKLKYPEEATPGTESMVQCAKASEDIESDPQESLQKSTDVDTEAVVLDLTVR